MQVHNDDKVAILFANQKVKNNSEFFFCTRVATGYFLRDVLPAFFRALVADP